MSDAIEHVVAMRVDPQHPVFAGHFPGRPIVPGVLLIDWALAALRDAVSDARLNVSPVELGTVKFLRPVTPGAELRIIWSISNSRSALRIECDGNLVASATLSAGDGR